MLSRSCDTDHHEFWPCDVSVLDPLSVRSSSAPRLHGPRQVTDAYLLALATAHNGCFVTFDHSCVLASVHGATVEHLTVL